MYSARRATDCISDIRIFQFEQTHNLIRLNLQRSSSCCCLLRTKRLKLLRICTIQVLYVCVCVCVAQQLVVFVNPAEQSKLLPDLSSCSHL